MEGRGGGPEYIGSKRQSTSRCEACLATNASWTTPIISQCTRLDFFAVESLTKMTGLCDLGLEILLLEDLRNHI